MERPKDHRVQRLQNEQEHLRKALQEARSAMQAIATATDPTTMQQIAEEALESLEGK